MGSRVNCICLKEGTILTYKKFLITDSEEVLGRKGKKFECKYTVRLCSKIAYLLHNGLASLYDTDLSEEFNRWRGDVKRNR